MSLENPNPVHYNDDASLRQNVLYQWRRAILELVTTVGSLSSGATFADNEVVAGAGTAWTLAHTPNPVASLILVQQIANFGGIVLVVGTDYTIVGAAVTTTNSLGAGVLRAWYRY